MAISTVCVAGELDQFATLGNAGNVTVTLRPVRATTATPYSRGNRLFTLAFSVVRECASAKAAEAYCLTHPRDVLRSGTLYIFAEGSSGDRQPSQLANAVLREVVCTHTGVSVTISYTVVGGQLT